MDRKGHDQARIAIARRRDDHGKDGDMAKSEKRLIEGKEVLDLGLSDDQWLACERIVLLCYHDLFESHKRILDDERNAIAMTGLAMPTMLAYHLHHHAERSGHDELIWHNEQSVRTRLAEYQRIYG